MTSRQRIATALDRKEPDKLPIDLRSTKVTIIACIERPLAGTTVDDLKKYTWPDDEDPARLEGIHEEARSLYEQSDHVPIAEMFCGGPFEWCCNLSGS